MKRILVLLALVVTSASAQTTPTHDVAPEPAPPSGVVPRLSVIQSSNYAIEHQWNKRLNDLREDIARERDRLEGIQYEYNELKKSRPEEQPPAK